MCGPDCLCTQPFFTNRNGSLLPYNVSRGRTLFALEIGRYNSSGKKLIIKCARFSNRKTWLDMEKNNMGRILLCFCCRSFFFFPLPLRPIRTAPHATAWVKRGHTYEAISFVAYYVLSTFLALQSDLRPHISPFEVVFPLRILLPKILPDIPTASGAALQPAVLRSSYFIFGTSLNPKNHPPIDAPKLSAHTILFTFDSHYVSQLCEAEPQR